MIRVVSSSELEFRQLPGRLAADPFAANGEASRHGLSVRLVSLEHQPNRSLHQHPKSAEVSYVVSGSGVIRGADGESPISAGDVILVPPGTPHATLPKPGSNMLLVCFFPHPDLAGNIVELGHASRCS